MNTEQPNSKNDIMQNQEEAMHHLVKATNKLDESNHKVSKEYTEEVRLEVEGESKGKTESIEKLDNRLEHLEANLKKIAENQVKMIEEFQKAYDSINSEDKSADKNTVEENEEDKTQNYFECGVCGRDIGAKGFSQHIKGQHDINIREMLKEDGKYKAEGYESDNFKGLSNAIAKDSSARSIVEIVSERLKEEYDVEDETEDEKVEKYACSICGNIYEDKRGVAGHLNMTHGLSGEGVVDKNIRKPKTHELDQEERKEVDNEDDYDCPYCSKMVSKHSFSRHLTAKHEDKVGLRDFFWDEQKEAYCLREHDIEQEDWQKFRNRFGKFDFSVTDLMMDGLDKGYNSEQEMYEKNKDSATQKEETEETEGNISDYEKAKRKASVSDRDMEIAEQTFHKIIHDNLKHIPDHNEKFISYSGNENIPGFETLVAGDIGALNMWRKIFSNTGLLTGINERVAENFDLSWERKGASGTPKNWVVKVERNDR